MRLEEFTRLLESADYSDAEKQLVGRAAQLVTEIIPGFRHTGEPSYEHSLEVGGTLISFGLPYLISIAGLLHDVLEDTAMERETLLAIFGEEIVTLVDGVTIDPELTDRHALHPILKKICWYNLFVLQVHSDNRVMVLKLVDRLHNLRTIHGLRPEKQVLMAWETVDFLIPLTLIVLAGDQVLLDVVAPWLDEIEGLALAVYDPTGDFGLHFSDRTLLSYVSRALAEERKVNTSSDRFKIVARTLRTTSPGSLVS